MSSMPLGHNSYYLQMEIYLVSNLWHNLPFFCQGPYKGRYTLGDKLLQHVVATDHSVCTGRRLVAATRWGDTSQRQIASCVLENFCEIFVSAAEFCRAATSRKKSIRLNLCDLLQRQILLQRQRFSQKFSRTHEAICRCNVSPRHVAATCRLVCTDL